MKEKKTDKVLLEQYHDLENPGSYGGGGYHALPRVKTLV